MTLIFRLVWKINTIIFSFGMVFTFGIKLVCVYTFRLHGRDIFSQQENCACICSQSEQSDSPTIRIDRRKGSCSERSALPTCIQRKNKSVYMLFLDQRKLNVTFR